MLQTGNHYLWQMLVLITWHSLSYNAIDTILIHHFQVKVLRDSTSFKRHTSAGGKGGKILLFVDFTIVIVIGKITMLFVVDFNIVMVIGKNYHVIVCWLIVHQASIHHHQALYEGMCQAYTEVASKSNLALELKFKTPQYCAGSLDKQEVVVPAGPPSPIDQPIAQWIAPEEACES